MSSFLSSGAILGDGKYLLGRKLGSGSLGDVYFGTDLESEEVFIICLIIKLLIKKIEFLLL